MLVHTLFLYTTREILVRDMLVSGIISNDWQYYDRNKQESSVNNQHQVLLLGMRRCRLSLPNSVFIVCLEIYISDPKSGKPSSEDAKKIIFERTGNGCERGKTPRGGRQGTPFNLPRCSSNLCHYHWNKRA